MHEVLRSPGRPLDAATRAFFEPRLGYDFGRVRIHADAGAAESARSINARAYTVGTHIAFDSGQFSPNNAAGRCLLAHELAHVAQQGRTSTKPRPVISSPEDICERAAGAIAESVASGARHEVTASHEVALVQRQLPNKQQIKEGAIDIQRRGGLAGLEAAEVAWRSKGLAEKLERESHLDGDINGPADAFRHCVLSCLITAGTDARTAKIITETHEEQVPNKPNETKMDLHNNEIGIACGHESGRGAQPFFRKLPAIYHAPTKDEIDRCVRCTWQKLASGLLWVIPDWDKGAAATGDPIPEKWEKPVAGKPQIPTVAVEDLPKAPTPTVNVEDLPRAPVNVEDLPKAK